MAHSKVGFITGVGGNPTGIGQYIQALDGAGIPAVIMANDTTTGLSDILALDTQVPHVMVFRVVQDGSEQYSVPDYSMSPIQAAEKHWNLIKPFFPQSVMDNRDRIWIQPINEVDKNRASWLGYFGVEIAILANDAGYKVAMFGWSSGEPEPEHWRTPGVLAYLGYCASNPDMACVAVHEYSFGMLPMEMVYPFHVGRFQALFLACDERGIPRPKVLVTEFGWSYNDIPELDQCLADIDFAAELYAQYPEVLGAGIWYLGPGFNNIANQVNSLINPVKDYTLNTVFPDPVPDPGCQAREPYKRVYWVTPPGITRQGFMDLAGLAFDEGKRTIGGSFDDAGLGCGLISKTAVLFDIPLAQRQVFLDWYAGNYPGTIVEFREAGFKFQVYPVEGKTLQINPGGAWNDPRVYNGVPQSHEGVDLYAPHGSRIVSVSPGIVDGVRPDDPGIGYGIYVRVKHQTSNQVHVTWYGHLLAVAQGIQVGVQVGAGQLLGWADNTGQSTGSHLHLTLQKIPGGLDGYIVDSVIDPTPFLEAL